MRSGRNVKHTRSRIAAALLLSAIPFAGLAQTLPGLDLTQPPRPSKPPELPPAEPAPPASKPTAESSAPLGPSGERDVALGDRVKAVQRKGFLKRHRFELTPILALSVNDAFYQKFGGGLRVAYNLADSFAVAARGLYFEPLRTDNVRLGQVAFQGQMLSSQLYGQAMIDGVWSPVYGKAAVLGRDIVHFDLFLHAGLGLVWSATSTAPRNEGPHLATDLGGGVRFYPKEWLAFELGLAATLYTDRADESAPSVVQKIFVANVGVSFFFPMGFDYVYP
jgi:outer membrane beta-barrel protein